MNVLHARVTLRDRSLADVLDLAVRFMVTRGASYAKVAAVVLVPLFATGIVLGNVLGWPNAWLAILPLTLVAEVPFTVLASRLVFEDEVHVRDVLGAALREAPRVVIVRVVALALTLLGAVFLLVPGVWLAVIFLFLGEVLLLERGDLSQTLSRTQRVATSASSDVVFAVIVLGTLPVLFAVLGDVTGRTLLSEVLQFRAPPAVWSTGGSALAAIGLFAGVPYIATARFLLYLNVRTRVEGWDIQTKFHAIAKAAEDSR